MANFRMIVSDLASLQSMAITAESEASSSMADDFLATEEPSEFWRSSDNRPTKTIIRGAIKADRTAKVSGMGIAGSNLWQGTGQVRYVLNTAQLTIANLWQEMVPTGIVSSSNLTGAATDVDEGFTPDGNWMSPTTTTTAWNVVLSFNTPSSGPETGAHKQAFWIYAKASASVEGPYNCPTLTASLYESGSQVSSLGSKAITNTTGQWIYFSWDASSLGTGSGANVEIRIACDYVAGAYISVGSVVWHCENGGFSGLTADSGWNRIAVPPDNPDVSGADTFINRFDSNVADLHDFGTVYSTIKYLYVFIREDHSPNATEFLFHSLTIPAFGYVEVGKLCAGIVFSPSENMQWGDIFAVDHLSTELRSDGGQEFGSNRGTLRAASLDFAYLTRDEAAFVMDRLVRRKSTLGPVLISILPNDDEEEEMTTFYATLAGQRTVYNLHPAEGAGRRLVLDFTEKV